MVGIYEILDSDEQILLQMNPRALNRFFRSFGGIFISLFGLPFLGAGLFMLFGVFGMAENLAEGSFVLLPMGLIFTVVGGSLVLGPLLNICLTPITAQHTNYIVTDKRLLTKSGVIGTDFESIPYESIKSVDVDVNIIDKLLGTGTISFKGISTEKSIEVETLAVFTGIPQPYRVSKDLKNMIRM